jgi:hypothetical protein
MCCDTLFVWGVQVQNSKYVVTSEAQLLWLPHPSLLHQLLKYVSSFLCPTFAILKLCVHV